MTLDYYIADIRAATRNLHDDGNLDDRLIVRWINTQRALWIKRQIGKEYIISSNISQTIPCIELKVATASECNLFKTDSRLLVSTKIPKPIELNDRLAIIDVRTPELLGYSITLVDRTDLKYVNNGRFNSMDIYATYFRDRLYLKVPENNFKAALLTYISYEAVLENPTEASGYNNCDNSPCFDIDNDNYPLSDALWEYIQGQIITNKYEIREQIRDTGENNESGDS